MPVSTELQYDSIHNLYLDPMNPRLGRHRMSLDTTQDELLEIMRAWVLDELAHSYLGNGGFWTHEPMIVVAESLYGHPHLVVVDGNRRLAALKLLYETVQGRPVPRKWSAMFQGAQIPEDLFDRVPYVLAKSRSEVQTFLGFRHVTGIKQWAPDKKAAFIATLIDEEGMSYQDVAGKIGSNASAVRKHYIAYGTLLQIEKIVEGFVAEKADNRFPILYMSIGTLGVQQYLCIDTRVDPNSAKNPVPEEFFQNLEHFSRWVFGTVESQPIVSTTSLVADFGKMLESRDAIEYLESAEKPKFEIAFRISGGDFEETVRYVSEASKNAELALMRSHAFKTSSQLGKAVGRLGSNTLQLLRLFPNIRKSLLGKVAD